MRCLILAAVIALSVACPAVAQFVPSTAKDLYPPALAKAKTDLGSDAALTNIFFARMEQSGVQVTIDMQTGLATGWVYRFYSASRDSALFLIAVKVPLLGVQVLPPPTGSQLPVPPLPGNLAFAEPWVDSPAALAGARAGGGDAFIASHAGTAVDLLFSIDNPADTPLIPKGKYWVVRFVAGSENLTCAVDAVTGQSFRCGSLTSFAGIPEEAGFRLDAPQPHPLRGNHASSIRIALAQSGRARITVHDALGRLAHVVADGEFDTGEHMLALPLLPIPGFYILRMDAFGRSASRTMVVAR